MGKENWIAPGSWALVLGSSSGFGEATSRRLADAGFNIFGVHFDRKAAMPHVEALIKDLKATGAEVHFFNVNAGAAERRVEVIGEIKKVVEGGGEFPIKVILHSLAFGTLRRYVSRDGEGLMDQKAMHMTLDVMAHSLVYWMQDLLKANLVGRGARLFAMTSAGSERVWASYGAVSAAKCALESHMRQLAVELASEGIAVNTIRAGVTDTPALRKIPDADNMIANAIRMNPHGRLTKPEYVANCICALTHPGTQWLTGNILNVDGGEIIGG